MPEADVIPIVHNRGELPVNRASGALLLVGPGLGPAGPKLHGGIFFVEIEQLGAGCERFDGDEEEQIFHRDDENVGLGGALGRRQIRQPIRLVRVGRRHALPRPVLAVDEPNFRSVLVKVHPTLVDVVTLQRPEARVGRDVALGVDTAVGGADAELLGKAAAVQRRIGDGGQRVVQPFVVGTIVFRFMRFLTRLAKPKVAEGLGDAGTVYRRQMFLLAFLARQRIVVVRMDGGRRGRQNATGGHPRYLRRSRRRRDTRGRRYVAIAVSGGCRGWSFVIAISDYIVEYEILYVVEFFIVD